MKFWRVVVLNDVEREIFIWMRAQNNFSLFPREVGVKWDDGGIPRKVVDEFAFWDFLYVNNWKDVYANIFSQRQKITRIYDTFLIDVDAHGLKTKMDEIETGYNYYRNVLDVLDDMGLKGRTYFSGRGFHIYIDFKPIRLEYYPKVIKEEFAKDIKEMDGVDEIVLGDRNRIARLPGSINGSTSLKMIRINPDWDLDKILECSMMGSCNPGKWNWTNNIAEELESIDIKYREKYSINSRDDLDIDINILKDFDSLPPCVKDGIKRLAETGELTHKHRLHLAAYLLRLWDYEKVVDVFRMASDFRERLTRYHLDYILDKELWPMSCKNAVAHGICPYGSDYKKCPFYQLSDGWIGRLVGGGNRL